MNTEPKSYFFSSFLILLLSAIFFLGIKQILPDKIFSDKPGPIKNVLIDSMLLDAFDAADASKDSSKAFEKRQNVLVYEGETVHFPAENFENFKGFQYLIPFYEKLFQLETAKKGKARIAYYGDSMTDGDMIVQDFRTNLQQQFGGEGVGFVSITSESAASRSSLKHEYSGNWKSQSYLNIRYPKRSFGVNGHVFFANDTSAIEWVKYASGIGAFNKVLPQPTLYFGSAKNKNGRVALIQGRDTIYKKLQPNQTLNKLQLSEAALKQFKLNFLQADSIPIYGLNFDNGSGIHVDNFSQRGNSGIPISGFNPELLNAFQSDLQYDLIVLHYGTNVLNYGTKNYNWYEKAMTKTVNKLRECFPGAAILIVSTADKATKYGTEMKTDSAVAPLTRAQKNLAVQSKTGFANLFQLMGGDGAMVKWVEEEPALAGKDYTHPNYKGSRKIASMIYDQIMDGYKQYKQLRLKAQTKGAAASDEN